MHRISVFVLMILTGLALSGCVISVHDDWREDDDDWRRRQRHNLEAISYLELGRSVDSVTAELGAPDLTESFLRDGREFRVLFYRTRLMHEDGRTSRDETTPLVFENGELVGWGESAVESALP